MDRSITHWRLWADDDGESHINQVQVPLTSVNYAPPAPPADFAAPINADRFVLFQIPEGWQDEAHPSPSRQYCVVLSATVEVSASDGTTVIFHPGDCLLTEDTHCKGHGTRAVDGPADVLMVTLE